MLLMPSASKSESVISTFEPRISDSDILSPRIASSTAVFTCASSGDEPVRALITLTSPSVPGADNSSRAPWKSLRSRSCRRRSCCYSRFVWCSELDEDMP